VAPEFGWGLVVKRDESDLLAALREDMLSTAAIAAAAILVVIVLTGLFARRLTAPILALSRAADRVAGGDLTARAPVSTPDEVGVLARTFNSMVGRIQGWHAELEAQVADRTADLRAQIAERERAEEATRGAQQKLIEQQRSETQRIQAELDKARAQLVSQTRLAAIGQLAGGIAHELRNPLGAARNAVFYLKRYLSRPEPDLLQHLGIIDQEIEAANRIISNLLDMARSRPPRKQAVSLAELIREVFEQLQLEEGIQWRVSLAPKSCTVEVDPSQLRQVLVNLVTNAAQSLAGGGGEIEVGGRCAGDFCEITVRDNGPGVAAEDRDRVFDALFTTKAKGTGMGLAICRDIVEQHDGSIELLESEGSGAAFRIRVPIWHEQER
jgi:signal transduction histidine kinase